MSVSDVLRARPSAPGALELSAHRCPHFQTCPPHSCRESHNSARQGHPGEDTQWHHGRMYRRGATHRGRHQATDQTDGHGRAQRRGWRGGGNPTAAGGATRAPCRRSPRQAPLASPGPPAPPPAMPAHMLNLRSLRSSAVSADRRWSCVLQCNGPHAYVAFSTRCGHAGHWPAGGLSALLCNRTSCADRWGSPGSTAGTALVKPVPWVICRVPQRKLGNN